MPIDAVDVSSATAPHGGERPVEEKARALSKAQWRRLLLPMMIATVIAAALAFLTLSLIDTWSVRRSIGSAPALDLSRELASVNCRDATTSAAERALCLQWKIAVLLEQQTINRRYHQANIGLLVRVSVKYLGFLTGMLISLVGAVFVLGRLTEAPSQVGAEAPRAVSARWGP